MINLYSEEELNKLHSKIKFLKILYILIAILFVVGEFLLIFFASYFLKGLYMAFVSVLAIVSIFGFIYFFDKRRYLLIIYSEFATILNSKSSKKKVAVIKSGTKAITLADSSCVYEIIYKDRDKQQIIYLSNIFENNFVEGKNYTILESCGYIVGYKNED